MSRIVLVGIGTRGDVVPLTGLGVRMQEAGHDVAIAAHALYDTLIQEAGLEFLLLPFELGADVDQGNQKEFFQAYEKAGGIKAVNQGIITALRDEPMDIMLFTPLAEIAGHPLAEAKGIPAVGIRPQPSSATAAHPPVAAFPYFSLGPLGNRWLSDLGAWFIDRHIADDVAGIRRELGLPEVSTHELRRRRTAAGWQILHGYSPLVLPRPTDWRPGLEVTGYWWPARPLNFEPPADVVEFLDAGPAPVFVSFGSNSADPERMAQMSALVRTALAQAGVRGIVQAGWAGLDVVGHDLLKVSDIPYDWLFPHCAAVVHHGGAGSASAALRAGVPGIAIPSFADQPFWARRYYDIGALAAVLKHRKFTADQLAAAITTAVTDSPLRDNVTRLAAGIAKEDGPTQVLHIVEAILSEVKV